MPDNGPSRVKPASPPVTQPRSTAKAEAPECLDRNQIEKKFAALEENLGYLYENVPFGCHTLDADGTYLSINSRELAWLGHEQQAVIGKMKFTEFLTPDSKEKFQSYLVDCIKYGHIEGLELDMAGKDDVLRHTTLYMTAIPDAGGNPKKYRSVLYDITERRQSEQALRESDQRKDEFLAMLAHELRNPLVPISNAAHILGRLEVNEPRIKWAQQVIETQVALLSRMVDDLLDVSRIANGKITLKLEMVELTALVEQLMQSVVPLAKHRGHQLIIRMPEQEVWLKCDQVRLSQILFNLLDNAIKYTPEGGQIEFVALVIGQEIEISVRDNGMGIATTLLPKVFDLFQQDERGLDRAQGGLGIGLTLVKRLVDKHGGRVAAYSEGAGLGSTFTIWLPVRVMDVKPSVNEVKAKRSAATGARVLVVDDDFAVADSTAKMLELEGYTVSVVDSGQSALEQIPAFRPQAVLLDIGLKGMDGFETAIRLRELPEGCDFYVVALTGYADEKTRARALASGCDHFMVKPVIFDVLDELLCKISGAAQVLPSSCFDGIRFCDSGQTDLT